MTVKRKMIDLQAYIVMIDNNLHFTPMKIKFITFYYKLHKE